MNWYKKAQKKKYTPDYEPVGEYLYHGTFDDKIYSIWQQGLKPSEEPHWGGMLGAESEGKVFFCANPEHTKFYTSIISESVYDATDLPEIFLLRVKRGNLPDYKRTLDSADELYVERNVPPEQIEILWGEHGWKNLKNLPENYVEGVSTGEWRENSIEFAEEENELV